MDFMVFLLITSLLEYCKSPSLQLNRTFYSMSITTMLEDLDPVRISLLHYRLFIPQ